MKVIKKICLTLILIIMIGSIYTEVFATQGIVDMFNGNVSDAETGQGITETRKIIGKIITIVQVFGVFIAVAMLMALGIKYMYASPGDKAQIKSHLTVYVIGAVVMFGAGAILEMVKQFFVNI